MKQDLPELWKFLKVAERLKTELRHSWTSEHTRQESVADHSWMMALLVMTLFEHLEMKVDQLRVLKMITLHDLAEAIVGDIPPFEQSERRQNKFAAEEQAMKDLCAHLSSGTADEFMQLWQEMEANETNEAKLAQCIDKIEAPIEHIIADISTWDENDFNFGPYYKDEYYDCDPALRQLKDFVGEKFWQKMEDNSTIDKLKPEDRERRKKELA